MKKHFLLLIFSFFAVSAFAFDGMAADNVAVVHLNNVAPEVTEWSPEMAKLTLDRFLNMTPKEYKKITGEKLGFKRTIALKMAQHKIKKQLHGSSPEDLDKTLYIVLAIFIPFVAVGIATDWQGSDWVVALLLSLLCGIPGIIYALIKMKDYYPS